MNERFEMRLDEGTLDQIDHWADQQGIPSRAEAVRQLIEAGLAKKSTETVHFSDGEKLLLWMMGEMYKALDVNGEIDPSFIKDVIAGGHYWAPIWTMPGVFHGDEDRPQDLSFVVDVLDMWNFLERGYEELGAADKKRVQTEADPFGKNVTFPGFDGNNETSLLSIARFLINDMDRFSRFEGRELNSHMPIKDAYRRMLAVFEPIRRELIGVELDADQIIRILRAMQHPG